MPGSCARAQHSRATLLRWSHATRQNTYHHRAGRHRAGSGVTRCFRVIRASALGSSRLLWSRRLLRTWRPRPCRWCRCWCADTGDPAVCHPWRRHQPVASATSPPGYGPGYGPAPYGYGPPPPRGYYDQQYGPPPPMQGYNQQYGPPPGYNQQYGPPPGYGRQYGPPPGYYGGN